MLPELPLLTGSGLALNALNPNRCRCIRCGERDDALVQRERGFEASWVNVDDGSYVRVPNVQGKLCIQPIGNDP